MNDQIRSLLDALRKGSFDDPEEKIDLLAAALQENGGAPADFILSLVKAPQAVVRAAAVLGCKGRKEPELLEALKTVAKDSDDRVREALARSLQPLPHKSFNAILIALCRDSSPDVQEAALEASAGNPAFAEVQSELLLASSNWGVRESAAKAAASQEVPQVIEPLFRALSRDPDEDVARQCADSLEKRINANPRVVASNAPSEINVLEKAEKALTALGADRYPGLLGFIRSRTSIEVSTEELTAFGTDLSTAAEAKTLPPALHYDLLAERLVQAITSDRRKSIVLLGEPGVGKTALINELVYRLSNPSHGGWRILRMAPTDFMVGTTYIGEWETRVTNLVKAIRKPRRVLLYIPNFGDMLGIGKHSKSDHNVLTALLPYIQDGSILILGESTPAEFERGFARAPAIKSAFEHFLLEEPTIETTRTILTSLKEKTGSTLSEKQLDQVIELSGQFLVGQSRPGNAVRLFHAVHEVEQKTGAASSTRQILEALSASTGLPVDLLDDEIPLDFEAARSFFESRVLGQREAIETVLDLVTLIKAGLTDPQKPMGVFLFVGPTGVGKTELARSLAEFIFGDAKKLLRFDMSEFADAEGFQRLIDPLRHGSLTASVRQSPFSVVLMDEIEKSHVNVFDLCLQLFDAGRLTDAAGRTTDFRRTIVVLTSNVGAARPVFTPIGFKALDSAATPELGQENTYRELSRFFRPEFLNRIDRIVYFRPLALDVAENIARKEIDRVLARGGIQRRHLTIEVDPSAVSLLVREGYSPHFGARPLKRAVEKLLLIPLARAIAAGKLKERSILRLFEARGRIETQVVSTQKTAPSETEPSVTPADLQQRADHLQRNLEELVSRISRFEKTKSALLEQTHESTFYKDSRAAAEVFDKIHRIDQFLAYSCRLVSAVTGFETFRKQPRRSRTQLDQRIKDLEVQMASALIMANAKSDEAFHDALIHISLVTRQGDPIQAPEILAKMVTGFAALHRMQAEILGENLSEKEHAIYILVAGLGASALLAGESGLHEFQHTRRVRAPRTGKEIEVQSRELVRVQISPFEENGTPSVEGLTTEVRPAKPDTFRLLPKPAFSVQLFDPASMRGIKLALPGNKKEAIARAAAILAAEKKIPVTTRETSVVIRKYELGIGSRARDLRTGASTTHLPKLFKGHLELLSLK